MYQPFGAGWRPACEVGCAAGCEAERADEAMVQASIKAWRCNSLHVAGVVYSLINDGLDEGIVYTCCAMGRLTHQLHREIVHFDNLPLWDEDFTTSACVRERIAAIMDDERHQRRERQEREAEAAEAAEELRAVAEAEAARQLQLAEEAEVAVPDEAPLRVGPSKDSKEKRGLFKKKR